MTEKLEETNTTNEILPEKGLSTGFRFDEVNRVYRISGLKIKESGADFYKMFPLNKKPVEIDVKKDENEFVRYKWDDITQNYIGEKGVLYLRHSRDGYPVKYEIRILKEQNLKIGGESLIKVEDRDHDQKLAEILIEDIENVDKPYKDEPFNFDEETGKYVIEGVAIAESGAEFFEMFKDDKPYEIKVWENGKPVGEEASSDQFIFTWDNAQKMYKSKGKPLFFRHSRDGNPIKYEIEVVTREKDVPFRLNTQTNRYELTGVRIPQRAIDFFNMFKGEKPFKIRIWKDGVPYKKDERGKSMDIEWEEITSNYYADDEKVVLFGSQTKKPVKYEIEIVDTKGDFYPGWDKFLTPSPVNEVRDLFSRIVYLKRQRIRSQRAKANIAEHIPINQHSFVKSYIEKSKEKLFLSNNQYILFVDKNFSKQRLYIVYFDAKAKFEGREEFIVLGSDAISTGDKSREIYRTDEKDDHYSDTPSGFFKLLRKFPYKYARKDKYGNDRNMFFFGKQIAERKGKVYSRISFAMHPTKPEYDRELGYARSHGCVRQSSEMYNFLNENNFFGTQAALLIVADSSKS
ncbi:MAG: hypothetical protein UR27_C0015G0017 [Candidatus Peregrinibacteria bacterium GW2011_GWA2_33_10]|nr:MAG: hypothetical protein UR27_C0015G0017 [Candidatus Peregrinibacteria bacterium GW2011_GWA2_33_10]KKP39519.1 MAG: hypothetical protein UR30_C0010G0015 [Candidatus Peregrinibacteria bacterium GW2011_GWC2_33_13]OGJ46650.1 MAG: hypothetical protein A2229_04500 [Candidatus Peregrinibacteria bacterium RIFOXYA2_FULL_33_7]